MIDSLIEPLTWHIRTRDDNTANAWIGEQRTDRRRFFMAV